jgi:hypothetical protein
VTRNHLPLLVAMILHLMVVSNASTVPTVIRRILHTLNGYVATVIDHSSTVDD